VSVEPGRQTDAVEPAMQPLPALTSGSAATVRAKELCRGAAAVVQRANTRLERSEALLASSLRRLTGGSGLGGDREPQPSSGYEPQDGIGGSAVRRRSEPPPSTVRNAANH